MSKVKWIKGRAFIYICRWSREEGLLNRKVYHDQIQSLKRGIDEWIPFFFAFGVVTCTAGPCRG